MTQQFPTTFIQTLLKLRTATRVAAGLSLAMTISLFPSVLVQRKGVSQFALLSLGVASAITSRVLGKQMQELQDITIDLDIVDRRNQISWYHQLTSATPTTVEVKYPQTWIQDNLVPDIVAYWLLQDKHILIIGGTGDGKSTLIQALVGKLPGWYVRAYDVDATVDDWSGIASTNVIGLGSNMDAIADHMAEDLEQLEVRLADRSAKGNQWRTVPMLTIAEELPALASELEVAPKWVRMFAKRGRKAKHFIVAIAQNDTVENLGLKGDAKVRDSCFTRVYLGKKAVEQAKKLGNERLEKWLQEVPKGRFLVDDKPAEWFITPTSTPTTWFQEVTEAEQIVPDQLPHMSAIAPQKALETLPDKVGTTLELVPEPLKMAKNTLELTPEIYIALRRAGHSKSHILKEIFSIQGRRFLELSPVCDQWESGA